jgi:non-ribosomal peptide synthetase component E (peptide arylation enzyme)
MGDFVVRDVLGKSCARVAVNTDANAARYVMVTSGTTSLPKMSLWTDNNLWYFGKTWTEAVAMSFKDRAVGLAPAGTGSVGYVYAVLFPVLKGATSIIQEIWSPSAALVLLKRERATHVTAVPTQLVKMLRELGAASIDLPSLRAVTSGGATMPPEFAKRLEETWNCRIQTVYGSTDGGVALMTRLEDPKEMRHVTVGRALPLTDVKVIAENGQSVNAGDTGEIVWRGPSKTFGYLNEAERTQEAFAVGGYFRSGDLGTMDSDGYVRIVGRAKDIIIRGGQNISPRELEEAIGLHPSVAESAVVGLPDTVYGERICAVVALRAGAALDLAQLVAFLTRSGIARFKLPERLEIVGSLPTNAAGKVSKADVRDLVRRLSMNAYDA